MLSLLFLPHLLMVKHLPMKRTLPCNTSSLIHNINYYRREKTPQKDDGWIKLLSVTRQNQCGYAVSWGSTTVPMIASFSGNHFPAKDKATLGEARLEWNISKICSPDITNTDEFLLSLVARASFLPESFRKKENEKGYLFWYLTLNSHFKSVFGEKI